MKPNPVQFRKSFTWAAVAALCIFSVRPAVSAPATWTGGAAPDGNWTTAGNWGGVAPSALDLLTFAGTTQLQATNDFAAGTIFNNLSFSSTAGAFALAGNSLVLTNGTDAGGGNAAGGSITNFSANPQTNAIALTLSAGRHNIANLGAGKLNLNGAITRNAGALAVFTNSGGGINVAGALSTNGQNNILGGWATLGDNWATLDASSNVVAFTGYTTNTTGAIANNAANNVKLTADTGAFTVATGTTVNSIMSQLTTANRNVTITGVMKLGPKGGIFRNALSAFNPTVTGGFLTANGGGEITLSDAPFNATANNLTVNSIITNDAANVVSVNTLGYVAMNANNTYSGGTYISQGRVQASNLGVFGTGPVYVYPTGEAFLNASGNFTNNFFIAGIGPTETSGGQQVGAIRYGGTATNIGTITLLGNARIAGASGGNNTLAGKITGPGRLEFTAATGNNSSINLINTGTANDWSGGLRITVGGGNRQVYLKLGADDQIPDGAGKGDVTLNCTSDVGRFDLNGFNETINGLSSALNVNNQVQNNGGNPCTLTLGNNDATASFGGGISDNGNALTVVKIGGGTQTFTGANTYNGGTLVLGGTLALSGTGSIGGGSAITVSNATLDVSGQSDAFNLTGNSLSLMNGAALLVSPAAQPTVNILNLTNSTLQTAIPITPVTNLVVTTLAAGGTANPVNITALPGITSYPQQFALIQYASDAGDSSTLVLGTMPSTYAGYISNDTANAIIWLVATNGPVAKAVVWNGNVNGDWDTTTLNWLSGGAASFNQGDFATFDDTLTGTPNVNLTTALAPFTLVVSNAAANYVFSGTGKITGVTGLTKQGGGSLLLDNSGVNDFTGFNVIEDGTVQVGNNDANGSLGSGALTNGGALVFNRTDNYTNANAISGSGSLSQNGSGTLTLSGVNADFTGPITVTQGTLKAGTGAALGTADGSTTISSGAVLDVNAQALTNEIVNIAGNGIGGTGAIINSSTTGQNNALTNVTLTADATVGGTGRWDIRGAGDSLNLANFTLTKTGTNQVSVVNATIGDGNIVINQGTFDLETGGPTFAGTGTVTVNAAGTLGLFANPGNSFQRPVTLNGGTIKTLGGALSSLDAPVTLTANATLDSANANPGTVINSVISESAGSFGLTKTNAGAFFLGGANTYSGPTLVVGGTLALTNSGSIAGSSRITVSNATLDVTGESGTFTLATNAVILTGNAVFSVNGGAQPAAGILSVTNSTLRLVAVNYSQAAVLATNLNLGAPTNFINVVSFATPPIQSQFPLVQYTSLAGTFNAGLSGLPVGYAGYLTNNPVNKSIDLVLTASLNTAYWNGGSAANSYWSDALNWNGSPLLQNNPLDFNGGARLNNTNDTPANTAYAGINFDNGPYVLNGNAITLPAGSGITNNAGSLQTVNLPVNTSGTNLSLVGNSGGLVIGGGLTNTAAATSEFLTLSGNGTITNLLATPAGGGFVFLSSDSSAVWSILDNATATPVVLTNGGFNINSGATLNFGSGSSAPNLAFAAGWGSDNGIGNGSGTTTFNMINGTLTLPVRISGQNGNLNMSGGTLNVWNQLQWVNSSSANVGVITASGGILNVASSGGTTAGGVLYLASRGNGTLIVTNTALVECATLDLSRNASAGTTVGTLNLDGGTLLCSKVTTANANASTNSAAGSTATFNFNGGTLKANASSATFFQGGTVATLPTGTPIPITTVVKSGGAVIDTTNFNIAILEPLQHDVALDVTPDGGLIKNGSGTLTMAATNSYTGLTTVSNGTLLVNGIVTGDVTVKTNATAGGAGIIGGTVNVQQGGALAAGAAAIGALTLSNSPSLNGSVIAQVDRNGGSPLADEVIVGAAIAYGGTLVITNTGAALVAGDTFTLFNATSYSGAFTLLSQTPGQIVTWDTNNLVLNGTIQVATAVPAVSTVPTNLVATVSGNTLTLSWPADHTGWTLQVQTNSLSTGLNTNWFDVPGSTLVNTNVVTINPANGTVFYRMVLQ